MHNFCINCGFKLGKDDNFCMNCGARVDRSDEHSKLAYERREKRDAKRELKRVAGGSFSFNDAFVDALLYNGLDLHVGAAIKEQVKREIDSGQIKTGGVEYRVNQLISEYKAKREMEKGNLKIFDEVCESQEIQSGIRKNHTGSEINSIKSSIRKKISGNTRKMSEKEIRDSIKIEFEKAYREREKARIAEENARIAREKARIAREEEIRRKIEANEGGYCGLSCAYCYEEFLDSSGGIIGDFSPDGFYEYYCSLGHTVSLGSFCEDYR